MRPAAPPTMPSESPHPTAPRRRDRVFSPGAAVMAWLWPGLGHISHGERARGVLIMFGILFLFFTGLLVGGVDAVDRREDHLWFLAQSLCGPIAFAADFVNQSVVKQFPPDRRLASIGIAHPNEMGTLFIALAGLMNLVVILDALHFAPPAAERRSGGIGRETGETRREEHSP